MWRLEVNDGQAPASFESVTISNEKLPAAAKGFGQAEVECLIALTPAGEYAGALMLGRVDTTIEFVDDGVTEVSGVGGEVKDAGHGRFFWVTASEVTWRVSHRAEADRD